MQTARHPASSMRACLCQHVRSLLGLIVRLLCVTLRPCTGVGTTVSASGSLPTTHSCATVVSLWLWQVAWNVCPSQWLPECHVLVLVLWLT